MHLLFRVSFVDSTEINYFFEFAVLPLPNLSTGQSIHVQCHLHDIFNGNIQSLRHMVAINNRNMHIPV